LSSDIVIAILLSTTVREKFPMAEKFGEKLRKLRTSKKLTLEELAAVIGSSKAYVWQLENKDNAKPSAELLLKIANYFSESPEYFLDDTQIEPSDRRVGQVEDAFFRKFKKLSESDKRTIERIASGFDDED